MEDLPDSHVLSTHFMKSDWLELKYLDVGMKCKQSHVIKCSVDHQKCLVDHHPKQTHMDICAVHMHARSHDQNTLYKSP